MPDAGVLATILLIVGLFLLALELMIPSFGMIGILSAITLLISAWSAWQAWWGTSPGIFWTYAAFWLLGIPGVMGGGLFLLQNTSFGDRLVLRGPAVPEGRVSDQPGNRLQALVGQVGTAMSVLTPGGIVNVDNQRLHAESPGMVIEAGATIRVVAVKGNRLVVRIHEGNSVDGSQPSGRANPDVKQAPPEELADTVTSADGDELKFADSEHGDRGAGMLDFDIPED